MAIETDLNVSPYFDDYNENKNYHRVLFKPSVSVQVRELNQLQTILQNQIERFGNNIFKKGTIIEGCSFTYNDKLKYVKLLDTDVDTGPVSVARLAANNLRIKNSNNLIAIPVAYTDGYESTPPDLKTLYLNYLNSGDSGTEYAFQPGQELEVYNKNYSLGSIIVNNGGVGFSNSDTIVITPSIAISVGTGTFSVGEYISDLTYGSNLEIIDIDETSYANSNVVVLKLQPRDIDLANSEVTSNAWSLGTNNEIRNTTNTATGTIIGSFGTSARARIRTSASGKITTISLINTGINYTIPPVVRVRSIDNIAGLSTLDLQARNYIQKVKIHGDSSAVGNSYSFSVGKGIIYQKGHFIKIPYQTVVVSKYNNQPNNVSVVFKTVENIINSNQDTSLLDNSLGTENETAPGADRLNLTSELVVVDTDIALGNNEAYILTSFSEGLPFRQNQYTAYNAVNDEMAERTSLSSGNFVTNRFDTTTRSPANSSLEGNTFTIVVDPGQGYVSGYKVSTFTNFAVDIQKATDTLTINSYSMTLQQGNYFTLKEVAGLFQYSTGDRIELYDTAASYISNTTLAVGGSITPVGNLIGYARIKAMTMATGVPGTETARYKLYLFDLNMNPSKNIRDVKSVYYNGVSHKGIADIDLTYDVSTNSNIAILQGAGSKLVFDTMKNIKNANNIKYLYKSIASNVQINSNGVLSKSLISVPDEYFVTSGALTNPDLKNYYIAPATASLRANTPITGTVNAVSTSSNLNGTTTTFTTNLKIGDFIYVYANNSAYDIKRVTKVVNNTLIQVNSNLSFSNTTTYIKRYFPKYVPIPFGERDGFSGNVDSGGNILTLDLGMNLETSANVILGYTIRRTSATPGSRTADRNLFVKLNVANNVANTDGSNGPWYLGVSDVFRLKNVYLANSTVGSAVNTNSTDVTDYFYIDHNHKSDYVDGAWLYIRPDISFRPANTDWLLVKFDKFKTQTPGMMITSSYVSANASQKATVDSKSLSQLGTDINTLEVPEFFNDKDGYYDLLTCFDFRLSTNNTANVANAVAGATINPTVPLPENYFGNTADPTQEKKFPLPGSTLTATIEYYVDRNDLVHINKFGKVLVTKGSANSGSMPISYTKDSIQVSSIYVPSYPSIPEYPSDNVKQILNSRIASEKYAFNRINNKIIRGMLDESLERLIQPKSYSMRDIARLEQRIKNIEYAVSLSLLESNLQNKVIPSSISPDVNRFKYGFFVDDFTSKAFTDGDNPEYSADVILNTKTLQPLRESISIKLDGDFEPAYTEYNVVSQLIATQYVSPNTKNDGDSVSTNTSTNTISTNTVIGNTNTVVINTSSNSTTSNTASNNDIVIVINDDTVINII